MKNICVVQGGSFLLGISEQDILGRMPWVEAVPLLWQDGGTVVQLSALLERQFGGIPPPDAVCLELRGVFLVVDQIVAAGAALLNPPGPLPPSCPRLAARLCPQVTLWGDTPVLLLDPAQLLPVSEELGEGIGIIAIPEPTHEQPADLAEELSADTSDAPEESLVEPEPLAADPCTEEAEEKEPESAPPSQERQQKEESSTIDEDTFKKVMAWTVACFKRCKAGEELRLGIDQLPPELASLVREKGLSSSIIQYLIDQIVLRCQESAGRTTPDGKKYAG